MNNNIKKQRIDWIDISRGIAIIFVYLGHWITPTKRIELFAYSFHLQLFFILSGFFALKHQEKPIFVFINKQIKHLLVPLMFFGILNIVYFDISSKKTFYEITQSFFSLFLDLKGSVSPELWFLPTLFVVSVAYYFLFKILKNKYIILIISYVLYIIKACWQSTLLGGIILKPFVIALNIFNIPSYLMWYSLGVCLYSIACKITKILDGETSNSKKVLIITGTSMLLATWLMFSFKTDFFNDYPQKWSYIVRIVKHNFIYQNYKIVVTLLICISIMFISYILRKSTFLLELGKNTMILMGIEFISKNFLIEIFHVFNIGLPSLDSELQVIFFAFLTIIFGKLFFKSFNKHIPYLIGK